MRDDLFELQLADVAKAERKGERMRLLAHAALQRAQGLLQDVAVDFDPMVAEVDERRALIQQEANLVRRHGLAGDAHDELEADALRPRPDRRRGVVGLDFGGRRDGRREIDARDTIARVAQIARATPHEVLGLTARQVDGEGRRALLRPKAA